MADEFEWDDQKAETNLAKHAISFQIAKQAFDDPAALDRFEGHENGEERFNILGMVHGRLLFVVYTIRNGRKRIISARLAVRYEKRIYHEGQK
ncbi:MAG TPA: BrnT family toxin [Hyphomicrobiaceae bacterium]|nr:BrnT family toxin [Hyphomicrobiaceae bacterium]